MLMKASTFDYVMACLIEEIEKAQRERKDGAER